MRFRAYIQWPLKGLITIAWVKSWQTLRRQQKQLQKSIPFFTLLCIPRPFCANPSMFFFYFIFCTIQVQHRLKKELRQPLASELFLVLWKLLNSWIDQSLSTSKSNSISIEVMNSKSKLITVIIKTWQCNLSKESDCRNRFTSVLWKAICGVSYILKSLYSFVQFRKVVPKISHACKRVMNSDFIINGKTSSKVKNRDKGLNESASRKCCHSH